MVEQYPHFLFVFVPGIESVQDDNGNWIPGTESDWSFHSKCREETNGKGTQIMGVDGKLTIYSSMIYLPKGTVRIAEGTEVLVSETDSKDGQLRVKGTCLKFDAGQLNCRLWV